MTVLDREQWTQLQARYDVNGDPLPTPSVQLRAGYADLHFESDERETAESDVTVHVTERATRIDIGDLELYADAKLGVTLLRKRPPYPIKVWEVLYDRKAEVAPRDALDGLVEAEAAANTLGRALEWALYWIARQGVVPVVEDLNLDPSEAERWHEARAALKLHGPESDDAAARHLRGDLLAVARDVVAAYEGSHITGDMKDLVLPCVALRAQLWRLDGVIPDQEDDTDG